MNLGLNEEGVPVCEPFCSIEDVLGWTPPEFCCNGTKSNAPWKNPRPLESCSSKNINRSQLLICHDLFEGYLDDRFTQGSNNPDAYRFYNWSVADTFVYFGHNFVTVPPFGWVCTAHQHGVNVLGTILTEWDEGADVCKEFLQSKSFIDKFVLKLVEIMLFYGFDGWLINIENKIQATDVPLLQYFVQQLTFKCHSCLSHAKVLWYDSVTHEGILAWQDALNAQNEMFFEVADGIYLNYALTEEKLEESLKKARLFSRQFDVYAGVDVHGRCTPGGGGFNCKEITQTIIKKGLSCAIFAQAWVYESFGADDFDANDKKFWQSLNGCLPLRSVSLPVSTSFCRGYGRKYYFKGEIVSEAQWHNLSLQQLQPSYLWEFETSDAFLGGGCLKMSVPNRKGLPSVKRIHLTDNEPLHISAIWKINGSEKLCDLGIVLIHEGKDNSSLIFVMNQNDVNESSVLNSVNSSLQLKIPVPQENVKFVLNDQATKDRNHGWIESSFCVDINQFIKTGGETLSVKLAILLVPQATNSSPEIEYKDASVSLGHLKIHQEETNSDPEPIHLVKNSCLLAEASFPVSRSQIASIVSHEIFCSQWEAPCPESVREQAGSGQESHACSKTFEVLSDSSIATDAKIAMHQHSCYFIHWKVSNDSDINFYLIFFQDNDGVEHFTGASISNCYVYKHKHGVGVKYPVGFIILPVLKLQSFLFGPKLKLNLQEQ